ncbi:hypothetical protein BKA66DRAFT_438117 [Pyrenochaeta sp. MPI-SDFR-AT-0127]|nr:hypothetical protein BKA66DRAFT_438117 [Pyrenochaeta sp. MPI-SDFR-AT-0127]
MPGLPKNVLSTYQQYKNHTDSIAQWLASTAKAHGYVSSKTKNAKKEGNRSQGRPTYTLAIKEWTALAEFIAKITDPPVQIPQKLADLLDATISLRQSYSTDLSDTLDDSAEKKDSDDRHTYFLNVLKKVRETLGPRLPKPEHPTTKPKTMAEVLNLFEHLNLEEPFDAFQQAPTAISAAKLPQNEPIYKAERTINIGESFFAFYLLIGDLNRLRTEVSHAWARYKHGMNDLVTAALTTNTAVDLARSMTDDSKSTFAKHGGAHRMLQVYYAAQCLAAGSSEGHKARPGDDMNFSQYKLAEALFWPASQLLTAFCDVVKENPNPEMKRGFYGEYTPHSDCDSKRDREKYLEDKVLLLEMLPEFYYYCRVTEPSPPPVEDELTRGLRTMFKTKEPNLPLVFATTLFLDIHHILRHEAEFGFKWLTDVTQFVQGDIEEEMDFHKDIQMDTWSKENDAIVQHFVETLQFWCHEDQQRKAATSMKRINIPESFYLYRQHPWCCGLWKYFALMRFHEMNIVFVNAWGSVMSCAHLYNALDGGTEQELMWKDMDVAISLEDSKTFFIGEAPKGAAECLKRYAIAMGTSAANLAKATRKKEGLVLSKRGPKGLKELGSILQTFKGRFCDANGQNDLRAEDVQKILENANWEYEMDENDQVLEVFRDTDVVPKKGPLKQMAVPKLLGLLRDLIQAEIVEISFDFLRLHRQCWRLLRIIKDACRDDLIKTFGPSYIVKESELPFVVGYVLMSATSTQQVGDMLTAKLPGVDVTDRLMTKAQDALRGMIDAGAGSLIVEHILPKALGVQIDFEFEE